jgi:hypothetical protein
MDRVVHCSSNELSMWMQAPLLPSAGVYNSHYSICCRRKATGVCMTFGLEHAEQWHILCT